MKFTKARQKFVIAVVVIVVVAALAVAGTIEGDTALGAIVAVAAGMGAYGAVDRR